METTGIVEGCQEAATELGRNEEQHVSRHRGKNKTNGVEWWWGSAWRGREKVRWAHWIHRWEGTADPIPTPNQSSLPSSLHRQTHTADDYTEEPQKETITDAQLPLTANPLPPRGSKPRDGQKEGQRTGQTYGIRCVHEELDGCERQQQDLWNLSVTESGTENGRHITKRSYSASLCNMSITVWPIWIKTAVWQTLC